MNMMRFNPLMELDSLFNAYERPLAGNGKGEHNDWTPRVDIVENEKNFVIKAELAGVAKEDVKVEIEDNILTFSGDRKPDIDDEKRHRIERFYGNFSRSFSLPKNVDHGAIKATNKDGMLYLTIPKKAQEKKLKQIEIH